MNVVWKIPVVVLQLPEQADRKSVSARLFENLEEIRTSGLFLNRVQLRAENSSWICASTC